jgi:hypothetical protein
MKFQGYIANFLVFKKNFRLKKYYLTRTMDVKKILVNFHHKEGPLLIKTRFFLHTQG